MTCFDASIGAGRQVKPPLLSENEYALDDDVSPNYSHSGYSDVCGLVDLRLVQLCTQLSYPRLGCSKTFPYNLHPRLACVPTHPFLPDQSNLGFGFCLLVDLARIRAVQCDRDHRRTKCKFERCWVWEEVFAEGRTEMISDVASYSRAKGYPTHLSKIPNVQARGTARMSSFNSLVSVLEQIV